MDDHLLGVMGHADDDDERVIADARMTDIPDQGADRVLVAVEIEDKNIRFGVGDRGVTHLFEGAAIMNEAEADSE